MQLFENDMMKKIRIYLVAAMAAVLVVSCGVSGDPGHCYISVDWEYYGPEYGVYLYEDDNPDVPDLEFIDPGFYYDSYPGVYEYYYESEDEDYVYYYTGTYTLFQNLGTQGGVFNDGMDGADTYFDLYLEIYAKKGLTEKQGVAGGSSALHQSSDNITSLRGFANTTTPEDVQVRSWKQQSGNWTLDVEETVEIYRKPE